MRNKSLEEGRPLLCVAGYSKWAWQTPGEKKIRPHPRKTDSDMAKGHLTLPYNGPHLPPNQEDGCRRLCKAPHHHQEHPDKCNLIGITQKRKPIHFTCKLHDHPLAKVEHSKYLGITLQSNLKWNKNINSITNKANQPLGFLKRN